MEENYHDALDALIRRIFFIESVTEGDGKGGFLFRYTGKLNTNDSLKAYDQLVEWLKPYNLTALFREEDGKHLIFIIPPLPTAKTSNPKVNLVLFILTLISVMLSGALFGMTENLPTNGLQAALQVAQTGWPFAVALLAILGAHEFGHYFAGRYHGVNVTLPYFIPFPFSPIGTMGAFIQMKGLPKNKRELLDIGIAGPLAGLIVAVPVLMIGLSLSHVEAIPSILPAGQVMQLEGNSLIYLFLKWLRFGQLLPQPVDYGNVAPWLYWVKYFFTGQPLPLGGLDVTIHPVAWAGWTGLLVTALNLIPAGQLDGGHIFSLLFGRKVARRIYPFLIAITAGLGFLWSGWWLWAALIFFFGRTFAEPLDDITQLDPPRKWLAALMLIIFLLVFTPVPLVVIGGM